VDPTIDHMPTSSSGENVSIIFLAACAFLAERCNCILHCKFRYCHKMLSVVCNSSVL